MESTGRKQNLQFPQDDDQEIYGLGDSQVPPMDDNGDEAAMFFALVDRIRKTNEIVKQKRPSFDPAEPRSTAEENIKGKIQTSPSPWKPSFEWEDFSKGDKVFDANCGSSNGRDFANNSASALKEIPNPDIGKDESGKVGLSDKLRLVGNIDLNVEAPSEHPDPVP